MAISSSPPAQAQQLFERGLQYHREGDLTRAMQTYEQALALAPRHFGALHHVGIVAFQVGNAEMAAGFFRSALAVDPLAAAVHSDLGNALKEQQHLDEALRSYQRALELDAGDADTWFNHAAVLRAVHRDAESLHSYEQALALNDADDQAWAGRAVVLARLQRSDEALASARRALALQPQNMEALTLCGELLQAAARTDEAEACYRAALALAPEHAETHHQLGGLLLARGSVDDALACFDRALALQPQLVGAYAGRAAALRQLQRQKEAQRDDATAAQIRRELGDAYRTLGKELLEQGRPESAARMYAALLELDGADAGAWQQHARALNAAGRRDEALDSIARALALRPDNADYYMTRGVIQRAALRYEDAQRSYEQVVALAPRHPGGYTNLGSLLDQTGHAEQALALYEQALALDPACALARWNRSLVYLRRGDYARGWREYEWRWKAETLDLYKNKRQFAQPQWSGAEPLAGKTILLHAEQGLGDTLQFCRYATLVAQRGATVVLEVKPALAALMGSLTGVARVVVRGEALPPFDYHCPLMSLPLAFGTTLASVPAHTPYLRADPARVALWRERLGAAHGPRVGVVWGGSPANQNDHNRSIPLSVFAALFSLCAPPLSFVSLQKEVRAGDQALLDTLPVRQVADQLHDFADTAALCELLDVVVTVDTSVAHLAGALGKRVWILLQTPFEWRWLEHGAQTPWYPGATLYRQQRRGEWSPVIAAVAHDLAGALAVPR